MSIRKGRAFTLSFAPIDSANRPGRKSGLSFSAGEVQISKDGGTFVNVSNLPSEKASTGRYKIDLSADEMAAEEVHIKVAKSGIDDVDLIVHTNGQPFATVAADAGNLSTTFKTSRTESVNDYWKDALIVFVSGGLIEQVKRVSAYDGTTKFVTIQGGFTAAPSTGDRFLLINV